MSSQHGRFHIAAVSILVAMSLFFPRERVVSAQNITAADAIEKVQKVYDTITAMDISVFLNPEHQDLLLQKLNSVINKLDNSNYNEAFNILEKDIVGTMDGCGLVGEPDEDDNIVDCVAQGAVYLLVVESTSLVRMYVYDDNNTVILQDIVSDNTQDEYPNPPLPDQEPLPHESLITLQETIETFKISQEFKKLIQKPLNKALSCLQQAEPKKAIQSIEVFKNKTIPLINNGTLPDDVVADLNEVASTTQDVIRTSIEREGKVLIPEFCEPAEFIIYTTFYVDASALDGGDGSRMYPMKSIREALDYADGTGVGSLELIVAEGRYKEDPVILNRNLRIIGSGRGSTSLIIDGEIRNEGPFALTIEHVTIISDEFPGAVVVDHPCAQTFLSFVAFASSRGVCISQNDGALSAYFVEIIGTRQDFFGYAPQTGLGMNLTGGVQACLHLVSFTLNEGGALRIEGYGTKIHAKQLYVINNGVNSDLEEVITATNEIIPGAAAVEVSNQALFLGEYLNISRNRYIGFLVRDNAQAHIRYSHIFLTDKIYRRGGINAAVEDALLELTGFNFDRAELIGLVVSNANATAYSGVISNSKFGAGLYPGDINGDGVYDGSDVACVVECISDYVVYRRNEINLDSQYLPIHTFPPDTCVCPVVPFFTPWCE